MRCIFCKNDSTNSKSVEHIIPESLGNKNNILPKGVVCDNCNSYFGSKIEKTVLEMPYFKSLRGRIMIENKKGKIPPVSGFTKNKDIIEINFSSKSDKLIEVIYNDENTLDSILNSKELYVPFIPEPPQNNVYVSKFLGLIALEALAQRVSSIENWQEDFVQNNGLDELRNFARFGKGYAIWPYHIRRIDSENQVEYCDDSNKFMEKLNEYDFLIPGTSLLGNEMYQVDNLYFILGIMGIEYTINLTNAGLKGYITWLSENNNRSILQMEKSEFHNNINL
ncbi:HNH endonuclease [Maribacter sp. 4G9]|uniref:HNH endonuclease n=1 Tax=Maribacter sp. 4G9 TaxID=1889777 RepID=UPI000C156DAC|nr:HNH endonuclease [Maribacter sp. 4G9]PIB30591.1 hypothetical protein BFP75_02325 [Maribacter sp. 4G9]